MEANAKIKAAGQGSFLENPVIRNVMPCIGFVVICVVFMGLTGGRIFAPANIKLLLSQTYMLMIACSGVFMVMTMGGLDFSQGSLLGVSGIVICYLSTVNIALAIIGGMITGGLIGLVMMGLTPKTQQLLLGIIFLIEVAIFSDRKTGMIVK